MRCCISVGRSATAALFLIASVLSSPGLARAQTADAGKVLYDKHCQVCHGVTGNGKGPLAETTLQKVADITGLKRKNNGVFPAGQVRRIIDGRQTSEAHGPRDMPHWGTLYRDEAVAAVGKGQPAKVYQAYIDRTIDALIGHLETLQK
ncbi:MAG: cytochrome c [Hyphomicrobiales bacterium]|nr:cytochrome c [Hyphomicrobiales bacterium]